MLDNIWKWQSRLALILKTIRLRVMFYRCVEFSGFQNIHHTTQIYGRKNGSVKLGKRISSCRNTALVAVGGKLTVGDYTSFSENCAVVCHEKIVIGSNCMFGPNSCIYDHDHIFNYNGLQAGHNTSPIVIGDKCWIGANVVILRGTRIGECCIIGAGTVVKGDIPSHSLVVSERSMKIKPLYIKKPSESSNYK